MISALNKSECLNYTVLRCMNFGISEVKSSHLRHELFIQDSRIEIDFFSI